MGLSQRMYAESESITWRVYLVITRVHSWSIKEVQVDIKSRVGGSLEAALLYPCPKADHPRKINHDWKFVIATQHG